jgi:serine/threonine-protein kinase RsbW
MKNTFHRTIANELFDLESLMNATTNFLEDNGVDEQAVYRVNLALEEMVTNVIRHGYDDYEGHSIDVSVEIMDNEVVAVIADDGHAFNPVEQERRPKAASLEEAKVGGLGIHILKTLLSAMTYKREGEKNILEIHALRNLPPPEK